MLRKTWLLVDEVGFVRFSLCCRELSFPYMVLLQTCIWLLKFVFNYDANLTIRGD